VRVYDVLDSATYLTRSRDPSRIGAELTDRERIVVIDEIRRLPDLRGTGSAPVDLLFGRTTRASGGLRRTYRQQEIAQGRTAPRARMLNEVHRLIEIRRVHFPADRLQRASCGPWG
jgi:hypothetical protein